MKSQTLAEWRAVNVQFGRRSILRNIDLKVASGDFWTLIGPNGAGKSTLLGLFNGLTKKVSGSVFYKTELVTPQNVQAVRLNIAHVFQATDIDPKMPLSVYESVLGGTYGKLGLFRKPGKREKASI